MPIDLDIIDRIGLEPPTPLEQEWKDKISVDDFAIYSTKVELILEEAKQVLMYTSLLPGLMTGDCIVGLYTANGDLALASVGTYLHVATGVIPIKYIIKHFKDNPSVGIHDGDSFFCNEALYGGIHNPDMINLVPIFWQGEIIAWALAGNHEPETGATLPGGFVPNARSRYEEGIKFPPIKVASNFQFKTDVMDAIGNQVRDERMVLGDIRIRTAGCIRVRERVLELVQEKGVGFWAGLLRRVMEAATDGAKKRISELNDGTYRHAHFFDLRGGEEALSVVHVAVTKKKDEVTIDLSGSSPPTMSWLNVKPHIVRALFLGHLAQGLFAEFPASSGLLAPFKIVAPPNTVVNPPNEVAISGCITMGPYVSDSVLICLDKMLFDSPYRERIMTPQGLAGRTIIGGGVDQYGQLSSAQVTGPPNAGGGSARSFQDGVDTQVFYYAGWADCLDVETEESQIPVLYLFRKKPMDHSGCGKFRGGTGMSVGAIFHNPGPNRFIAISTNTRVPHEYGIYGGYSGNIMPFGEFRGVNWKELFQRPEELPYSYQEFVASGKIPVKLTYNLSEWPFTEGDGVAWSSNSAGGYGDVLERDLESVLKDLRQGIISPWTARNVYCIAFDEATMTLDPAQTQKLRETERAKRKKRGKPFEKFTKDWLTLKPSKEILRYYGPWPDGIK